MSTAHAILITGGTGYIGTDVAKRFVDLGFNVYLIDAQYFYHPCSKVWGKLYTLDLWNEKPSQTLNLGSGAGHSVCDVVKQIELMLGNKIPISFIKARIQDSSFTVADMEKTIDVLNYIPKYSDLTTIIASEIPRLQY